MKVTLEFDTSDEGQRIDYEIVNQAQNMQRAMYDFSQDILRKGRKYDSFRGKELSDERHEMLCDIEEEFYKIINEYNVDLDL